METVTSVFRCDFCGTQSEAEDASWVLPRCSVEFVLRGQRFMTIRPRSAYEIPTDVGPITAEEDERWTSYLCDDCMKRVSALFNLKLETKEERESRLNQEAAEIEARAVSSRGHFVTQFQNPTTLNAAGTPITDRPIPFPGGLVQQYPNGPHVKDPTGKEQFVHGEFPIPFVPAKTKKTSSRKKKSTSSRGASS